MNASQSGSQAPPIVPGGTLGPDGVERWEPPRRLLDPDLVLRLAGYRRPHTAPPPIRDAARRMAARADGLVRPIALLRVVGVQAAGAAGARLDDGLAFSGHAVGRLLSGCDLAVAFVLTLGADLETEVAELGERHEPLDAFLLDTAGWAAIEVGVRALRLDLGERARAGGRRLTPRLAPGYADWPLTEQCRLMSLLDRHPPVARLSEHGVLVPFKSVTGLFGITRR